MGAKADAGLAASDTETFQNRQFERIKAFRHILTGESDRGCALFAAAYLDKALSDYLYVRLVAKNNIERDLFSGTAPLATFSARIKMAYYVGGISASTRRDLDIIRRIRNDFAHSVDDISFDVAPAADRCKTLVHSYHETDRNPRDHFVAAALGILGLLNAAALTTKQEKEKPDDGPTEETKAKHRRLIESIASNLDSIDSDA